MSEIIVGIDLGTTNSALAIVENGVPRIIPIHGQDTLPSCVGVDPAGTLLVGQAARNQLVSRPEHTILSVKRSMGQEVKLTMGEKTYTPEEVSAIILRELKQEGEKALGKPINKAVITVPAFFNEAQRKATQDAGEIAGLEVVRIINEPTAAALAYGANKVENEKMLVYDLGGGTFDVSVVTVESGVVEVRASHGDTQLGGDDFDDLLVTWAMQQFKTQHGVDLEGNFKAMRRLKMAMETAKITLSDEPFATVKEEYLDGTNHLECELSRDEYEGLIKLLLAKTINCVSKSMHDAKIETRDINKVMLVGGSSRTPIVHELLEKHMGIKPRWEINPDLIVAMGAAVQGAIISGDSVNTVLVDISAHTFCTSTLDSYMELICAPLIPRGTPLPASKSDVFYTVVDNQKEVNIDAYQGDGPTPGDNILIDNFLVTGLSKVPSGNPIVIKFSLNLNGMLTVTATEKNSGLAQTVEMDTRKRKEIDMESAKQNILSLFGKDDDEDEEDDDEEDDDDFEAGDEDSDDDNVNAANSPAILPFKPKSKPAAESSAAPAELLSTAKDLRKRAEALLEKNVSDEDKTEIRTLLGKLSHGITQRSWKEAETEAATLSDLLFYLED